MNKMKPLERIELISMIAVTLQEKMTFSTIDTYLTAYGINCENYHPSINSKRVYVEEVLRHVDDNTVLKIAEELETTQGKPSLHSGNINFWKQGYFKLFISHLAKHKDKAKKLQDFLTVYGISAFVAHEDIEASREWQVEIEKALHTMDAMTVILTEKIKESEWCDQEIGFAVGKGDLIIPIQYGSIPYGFIGKYQALQGKGKTVGEVAFSIFSTIATSEKARETMLNTLVNLITNTTDLKIVTRRLEILSQVDNLSTDLLENMSERVRENNILIESDSFVKNLKELLIKYDIDIQILDQKSISDPFEINEEEIPF